MRVLFSLPTAFALAIAAATPAFGQNGTAAVPAEATDLARCKDVELADKERIAACTSVIESGLVVGQDLARIFAIRGNVHSAERNYEDAIKDYDQALALKESWGVLTLRGMAYSKMGAYDAAISDCGRALQLLPELAMARSCLDEAQKSKARLASGTKP